MTSHRPQVAAMPVRGKPGNYDILLVTSRESGRWVIPKGWPMKGKRDHVAAAQEAQEEAGVKGKIHHHPMGAYTYDKRLASGSEPVRVMVYLLEVEQEMSGWREKSQRKREWMIAAEAAKLVEEPGLADIILRVNEIPEDWKVAKKS